MLPPLRGVRGELALHLDGLTPASTVLA